MTARGLRPPELLRRGSEISSRWLNALAREAYGRALLEGAGGVTADAGRGGTALGDVSRTRVELLLGTVTQIIGGSSGVATNLALVTYDVRAISRPDLAEFQGVTPASLLITRASIEGTPADLGTPVLIIRTPVPTSSPGLQTRFYMLGELWSFEDCEEDAATLEQSLGYTFTAAALLDSIVTDELGEPVVDELGRLVLRPGTIGLGSGDAVEAAAALPIADELGRPVIDDGGRWATGAWVDPLTSAGAAELAVEFDRVVTDELGRVLVDELGSAVYAERATT